MLYERLQLLLELLGECIEHLEKITVSKCFAQGIEYVMVQMIHRGLSVYVGGNRHARR